MSAILHQKRSNITSIETRFTYNLLIRALVFNPAPEDLPSLRYLTLFTSGHFKLHILATCIKTWLSNLFWTMLLGLKSDSKFTCNTSFISCVLVVLEVVFRVFYRFYAFCLLLHLNFSWHYPDIILILRMHKMTRYK